MKEQDVFCSFHCSPSIITVAKAVNQVSSLLLRFIIYYMHFIHFNIVKGRFPYEVCKKINNKNECHF